MNHIIISGLNLPSDCLECTDSGLCIALSKFGIRCTHYDAGRRNPDCPLKQIITCKDCEHWIPTQIIDEITGEPEYTCNQMHFEWGEEFGWCYMAKRRKDD